MNIWVFIVSLNKPVQCSMDVGNPNGAERGSLVAFIEHDNDNTMRLEGLSRVDTQ